MLQACSAFVPCVVWPARAPMGRPVGGATRGCDAGLRRITRRSPAPVPALPRRRARRQRAGAGSSGDIGGGGGGGGGGCGRVTAPPAMVWVERAASVVVEAPAADAYDVYVDLEAMPRWSPWLRRVERDAVDPMLSRWFLGARGLEFSWCARIVENEPGRVIRWVSETGLNNRGTVSFDVLHEARTRVTLAIEFDVPGAVANAVRNEYIGKFVEGTLAEDLKRFRTVMLAEKRKRIMATGATPPKTSDHKSSSV
jgi:uncharacterized membrane protein